MNTVSRCPTCGKPLVESGCPVCDTRLSGEVRGQLIRLSVLVVLTVAAFFLTRAVAGGNDEVRKRQAAAWFAAAERANDQADGDAAVAAFRRAVSRAPNNASYRLALAGALTARHQNAEARRVLLALRELQPDDPATNIQLARLEATGADVDVVRRYYQAALAGLWRPNETDDQSRIRLELVDFLLQHGERARALSELLQFNAAAAHDAALRTRAARLFLSAGEPRRALALFESVLISDRGSTAALAGAGDAAFQLADYRLAMRYLDAAERDVEPSVNHQVVRLVLSADPLEPRLSAAERNRRLRVALDRAGEQLEVCLAASDPAPPTLEALRGEWQALDSQSPPNSRRDLRDTVDAFDLVLRIADSIAGQCPSQKTTPLDRALVLIGRKHGFDERP
ncbi:MAG: tetratricopeptide repeat protein [Vicinamibacterales bacterium]